MWPLQPPTAAPNPAHQEQRGTRGSRELAFPYGNGCPGPTGKAISTTQALIVQNPPIPRVPSPRIPFSHWARSETGTYLPEPRTGPTSQGAVEGTGWSSLLWGLPTIPTPPAPCLGWGAVGGSRALAGLTWRAHSAPSPRAQHESHPRCLAASAGPAPSPGSRSPADGLQGHRESVTATTAAGAGAHIGHTAEESKKTSR